MNIDAGLDCDFGEDLLSLVAHDYTSPDGLTIKVGDKDLEYNAETNTLTVPKTLKLNIKGTLDFVNIQNTRAVATITAKGNEVAKIQLYAVENIATDAKAPTYDLQLDAKIMGEYKNIVPAILDLCVYMGKTAESAFGASKKPTTASGASMTRKPCTSKQRTACTASMKKETTSCLHPKTPLATTAKSIIKMSPTLQKSTKSGSGLKT